MGIGHGVPSGSGHIEAVQLDFLRGAALSMSSVLHVKRTSWSGLRSVSSPKFAISDEAVAVVI